MDVTCRPGPPPPGSRATHRLKLGKLLPVSEASPRHPRHRAGFEHRASMWGNRQTMLGGGHGFPAVTLCFGGNFTGHGAGGILGVKG